MKTKILILALITSLLFSSCVLQKQISEKRYKPVPVNDYTNVYDTTGKRVICTCDNDQDAKMISKALNHWVVNGLYDNPNMIIFK